MPLASTADCAPMMNNRPVLADQKAILKKTLMSRIAWLQGNVIMNVSATYESKNIRELNSAEIDMVAGGLNQWQSAGIAVISISAYSPVTAAFGMPIGLAMFGLGSIRTMRNVMSH